MKLPSYSNSSALRLSLADFVMHDPQAPEGNGERRFCCPLAACRDKPVDSAHRSLSLNTHSGLWHCNRCGAGGKLVDAQAAAPRPIRPRPHAAPPPRPPAAPLAPQRYVGGYEIRDFGGTLIARRPRYEGADHGQRDADGHKVSNKRVEWRWAPDQKRPTPALLYGAETLAALPDGALVVAVEGEKARDALVARGFAAVGFVCGASATPDAVVLDALVRFDVVLWPDADASGQAFMRRTAAGLLERRGRVGWLAVPDAQDGDDAADYGGTDAELAALLAAAPGAYGVLVTALEVQHAQERDALTAQYADLDGRAARAQRDLRAVLHTQCNRAVRHEALTLAAVTAEALSAVSRGHDPTQPLRVYRAALAERVGVSETQISTHLDRLAQWQHVRKETITTAAVGPDGRLGRRTYLEVTVPALAQGGTLADALEPLAAYVPDDVASGERLLQGQYRRCPDHPHAAVVRRYTDICTECGQVVDQGERRVVAATAISNRAPEPPDGWAQVTCPQRAAARAAGPSTLAPLSIRTYEASNLSPTPAAPAAAWEQVTIAQPSAPNPALDPTPTRPPAPLARRCYACQGTRWWTYPEGGGAVCATCHPPPLPRAAGGAE